MNEIAIYHLLESMVPSPSWATKVKLGEVATAVAFLTSEDASFITGGELDVDGGIRAGVTIGSIKLSQIPIFPGMANWPIHGRGRPRHTSGESFRLRTG